MTDTIESLRAELAGCQKENAKLVARKQREGERGYLWAEWKRRAEDADMQLRGVKAELAEARRERDAEKCKTTSACDLADEYREQRDKAQARVTRLEEALIVCRDTLARIQITKDRTNTGAVADLLRMEKAVLAALTDTTEGETCKDGEA